MERIREGRAAGGGGKVGSDGRPRRGSAPRGYSSDSPAGVPQPPASHLGLPRASVGMLGLRGAAVGKPLTKAVEFTLELPDSGNRNLNAHSGFPELQCHIKKDNNV